LHAGQVKADPLFHQRFLQPIEPPLRLVRRLGYRDHRLFRSAPGVLGWIQVLGQLRQDRGQLDEREKVFGVT
jgi:hypothetical protein